MRSPHVVFNHGRFVHPPWPPKIQRSFDARRPREDPHGAHAYESARQRSGPWPGGRQPSRRWSRSPPPGRGRGSRFRERTPGTWRPSVPETGINVAAESANSRSLLQRISTPNEPERVAEDPRRTSPILVESPREFAPDSAPPFQPTTEEPAAETMAEPVQGLDAIVTTDTTANPISSSPQAAMEIDKSPLDDAPPGESDHQTITHASQEKMDAMAKHRTVLKHIWAQRVLSVPRRVLRQTCTEQTSYSYLDLIRVDTEILRESQEILETIPLSEDQRQKLEDAVLSLQGRIQACNQRLTEGELQLEQSLDMDGAHPPAIEELTARLHRDEHAVEQWIEEKQRQAQTPVPEDVSTGASGATPSYSGRRREDINEIIEALQNRLDDLHQLTAFDNDSFPDMVHAELNRSVSRSKVKNVLDPTELFSLDLLEEEFKGLVEKLDEAERKILLLEAKGETRAEELRKWMEADARVCPSIFLYFLQSTSRTRSKASRTGWKPRSSTPEQR
jgi:hypothetical protein